MLPITLLPLPWTTSPRAMGPAGPTVMGHLRVPCRLSTSSHLPKGISCALAGLKQQHVKHCHGNSCLGKVCDGDARRMAEHAEAKALMDGPALPHSPPAPAVSSTQQPQVEAAIPCLEPFSQEAAGAGSCSVMEGCRSHCWAQPGLTAHRCWNRLPRAWPCCSEHLTHGDAATSPSLSL